MVPKHHCGEFGWVLGRTSISLGAGSPTCLGKDENLCAGKGEAVLPLPVSHHSLLGWLSLMSTLPLPSPVPGFGVSVLFLGAGKAGAMPSCPALHTLPFSVASGIPHPECVEAHCF